MIFLICFGDLMLGFCCKLWVRFGGLRVDGWSYCWRNRR